MKKYFIFSMLLLFAVCLSAQQLKPVAQNIESNRLAGAAFQQIDGVINFQERDQSPPEILEPSKVSFFSYNYSNLKTKGVDEQQPTMALPLMVNNNELIIADLVEVPQSYYDFSVRTSSGAKAEVPESTKHYRGVIREHAGNSIIAVSFFEDQMMGVFSIDGYGTYTIGKLKNSNTHIIFNDANVNRQNDFNCETEEDSVGLPYRKEELNTSNRGSASAKCVKIYFETEYDIYQNLGSTAAVVNYVSALFNEVATLYQNESITTEISEIVVWDTVDPYTGGDTTALLNQFQAATGNFNGDLGQLLTFRSMGGKAAGFSGLCNSNSDLSLSVSGSLQSTFPTVPTYSWTVMVVTHELGHLFGSRHTHACVWNGNSTAIDGCSPWGTEGGCSNPGYPSSGGTIMSYCHLQGVGINFNNGFGPQPGNLIRNNVENASCIEVCCDPTASSDFNIESNCDDGDFSVTGVAVVGSSVSHFWGLYLTSVEGSTSDNDTIDGDPNAAGVNPVAPIQWGTSATFSNLSLSNHYYIKHGIWDDGCFEWRETRKAVIEFEATAAFHFENENGSTQDTFCLGEDIYIDGQASQGENRYFIDIWRRPLGSSSNFTNYGSLGWTVGSQVGTINISQAFANLSTPVFLEPDFEYEVKLAVANLENCVGWTPVTHRFSLECCNSSLSGEFNIGLTTSGEIEGEVIEAYPNIDATHQWFLLSSPNASGGPYTFVASGQGETFNYSNIDDDVYYFLIHKVITDCGEFCYGQSICRNCNRAGCELCGEIDCSVLDEIDLECENIPAPTGLDVDGFTLIWDPIPGITSYIIESPGPNDPKIECKKCKFPISIAPISVGTNSYTLPSNLRKKCFKWKVTAVCDGVKSPSSYPACYGGKKVLTNEQSVDFEQIIVSPNPTNGILNFVLEAKNATDVSIEVTDFYGVVVQKLANSLTPNEPASVSWDGRGMLRTGIYFVKFITPNETIIKKVIVN